MSDQSVDRRSFLDACAKGGAALGLASMPGAQRLGEEIARVPIGEVGRVSRHPGLFWHVKEGKETICDLCPSKCEIQPGERGTCGVRENENGRYITKVYALPCEIKDDSMEKGPFLHFWPGSRTLALGMAGCNLDCKYCQSATFAKARPEATDNKYLPPESLVAQLLKYKHHYRSVTFTFSEPMNAIEYVLDVARTIRPKGFKVLVHTAAHFCTEPFEVLCQHIDGINIDLKGFSEDFYKRVTGGSLAPVLDNIRRVRKFRHLWLELTNLVIPGYNDDDATFRNMCRWIIANCGADTPLHVSKFFPQYKFRNVPPTPNDTIKRLRKLAYETGLRYSYVGNMPGDPGESTYCPKCGVKIISRVGYDIKFNEFDPGTGICTRCGLQIPGIWG